MLAWQALGELAAQEGGVPQTEQTARTEPQQHPAAMGATAEMDLTTLRVPAVMAVTAAQVVTSATEDLVAMEEVVLIWGVA